MKKLFSLILMFGMFCTALTACGGSSAEDRQTSSAVSQTSSSASAEVQPEGATSKTEVSQEPTAEPEEPAEMTEQEKVESAARDIVRENYVSTTVSSVSVNDDLGTETAGDYILLVDLTWDVKNSAKTTKDMLAMYSSDFAARIGENVPNVSEVCIFWKVPYYSDTETVIKYSYELQDSGMYQTDKMISNLLD